MIVQQERQEEAAVGRAVDVVGAGNVGLALGSVAVLCGLLGGRMADGDLVDGLGILRALPTLYWAGVALGVVATFALLRTAAATETTRHAIAVPVLWLLLLHTAPQLAHAHPRLPDAWMQLGLLRVIEETGSGDAAIHPGLGWPGVHGTFMASMAGIDSRLLESLLRLWPTIITGITAILVAALGRRSYPTIPLIGSLSALMYILLAWTGQDYFSPQSIGLLWFVAMVVVLESGPLETGSAWSAMVPVLPRLSTSGGDRPASRSTPAFVALIVMGLGAIVSHPVIPLFICGSLFVLGLHGRSLAWRLLLLVGPAYVTWFLVAGRPWWGDGPGDVMRPFAGLVDQSAAELAGSATASSDYLLVSTSRSYLTAALLGFVLLIGTAMGRDRLRHLRPAVPLVPLVAVPVLSVVPAGISGTPMLLAIAFTLPFAAILAGRMLSSLRLRTLPVIGAATAALLCPLLLLTRFGGERFEFSPGTDRAAIQAAYDGAGDDTLFVADNAFIPWRDQGMGGNEFLEQSVEASEAWIEMVEAEATAAGKRRIVVLLTAGQAGWRTHGLGQAAGTLDDFAEWLLERPDSELLFHEGGSWAIEL